MKGSHNVIIEKKALQEVCVKKNGENHHVTNGNQMKE